MNIIEVKKLLAKQKHRPILQCIHYEDNFMIVCDAYSIIKEFTKTKFENEMNLDTNTMTFDLLGTYPDTSRLQPRETKPVNHITFEITPDGEYYVINHEHKFSKKQVDQTFKCIDIKDVLKLSYDDFILSSNGLYLLYNTEKYRIIISGVRS